MVMMIMIIMWKPSQTKPSQAKPNQSQSQSWSWSLSPRKEPPMDGPVWGIIRTPSNAAAWSCSSSSLILANATKMATNTASSFGSSSSRSSIRMQLSRGLGLQQEERGLGGCWRSTYSPSKLRLQVNQSSQSRRRETRVISGSLWLDVGVWEKS